MSENINTQLTFSEFQSFLSEILGMAESALTPDAHFLVDLGLDSLRLVELMLQYEKQWGLTVSINDAWDIQTVGDAYELYLAQMQKAAKSG